MKKALVFGLGVSGKSVLRYFKNKGMEVIVSDDNCNLQTEYGELFYPIEAIPFDRVDLVVISPGVPLWHAVVTRAKEKGIEVVSEIELSLREIQKRNIRACAITGTNGKTTTTALTAHILSNCGFRVEAVGNIGVCVLDVLDNDLEIVVLELSSFQLETVRTKTLQAVAIINITPDHLDRYTSFDAYKEAKWKIQECLLEGGTFVLSQELVESGHRVQEGVDVVQFDTLSYESNLQELFSKMLVTDKQNTLVALALCRVFIPLSEDVYKAIASFKKEPHRMEYIRTVNGVEYYNDSKATNVGAVIPAVHSFKSPIYLIAGGVHKGYPYVEWREHFSCRVKVVFAIGAAAEIIQQDLFGAVPVLLCATLEEAILQARIAACDGGTVLLSPGCSSYDMFLNYEERGNIFRQVVYSID